MRVILGRVAHEVGSEGSFARELRKVVRAFEISSAELAPIFIEAVLKLSHCRAFDDELSVAPFFFITGFASPWISEACTSGTAF
ncbi:hypothetical protein N9888_01415 [Akkermansiaceae bacterium]|nr:hypothetical protein [Akkermansiaceae bacterium]